MWWYHDTRWGHSNFIGYFHGWVYFSFSFYCRSNYYYYFSCSEVLNYDFELRAHYFSQPGFHDMSMAGNFSNTNGLQVAKCIQLNTNSWVKDLCTLFLHLQFANGKKVLLIISNKQRYQCITEQGELDRKPVVILYLQLKFTSFISNTICILTLIKQSIHEANTMNKKSI